MIDPISQSSGNNEFDIREKNHTFSQITVVNRIKTTHSEPINLS